MDFTPKRASTSTQRLWTFSPICQRTSVSKGSVPPEVWNRLGTKILPKLRSGSDLKIGLELSVTVPEVSAATLAAELRQILRELGLGDTVQVE